MSKPVTVGDIRRVIEDMPDRAIVICKLEGIDHEFDLCIGANDGRYGRVLHLEMGGYARAWNPSPPTAPISATELKNMDECFEKPNGDD